MGELANHSVVIHTVDTVSAVKLGGITSTSIPLNTETVTDESGTTFNQFEAISKQSPRPEGTTKSVMAALKAMTTNGSCINTDGTHPGVSFHYEQKQLCKGSTIGSSDHAEYLVDSGFMSPLQLSATRGEDVTLSFAIDALTKSGNSPLAGDYGTTLPSGIDASQFVLGHMKVAGILIPDVRSLNVDFGISLTEKTPQLAGVWPEQVGRQKVVPKATVVAKDPTYLDDAKFPLLGKAAAHADTIFYFKKRLNKSAFVDDATTEHFSLTFSGLVLVQSAISSSGTSTGDISIEINGSGTTSPLILTPNIAYDSTP